MDCLQSAGRIQDSGGGGGGVRATVRLFFRVICNLVATLYVID